MTIEVLDAAPDKLLTSVERAKTNLGITGSDQDDLISDLINQSSDWITSYTGRVFAKEKIKEEFVGKGLVNTLLTRTPIISVEELNYDGSEETDYKIFDKEAGILQLKTGFTSTEFGWNSIDRHISPYAEKKWDVTYTAGYVLPSWDSEINGVRDLPHDLERACLEIVKSIYRKLDIDSTIRSYKVGDTTVVWDSVNKQGISGSPVIDSGLPMMAVNILNFYRRAY